jgi:hypothetical protein
VSRRNAPRRKGSRGHVWDCSPEILQHCTSKSVGPIRGYTIPRLFNRPMVARLGVRGGCMGSVQHIRRGQDRRSGR